MTQPVSWGVLGAAKIARERVIPAMQRSAITRVDHRAVGTGKMGDLTSRLRNLYFDIVRGRVAKYRDWCYPVYDVKKRVTSEERTHVTVE